jgi:predicted nucleotidyltransferase
MDVNINELREKILPVVKKYGVKKVGLFGSYVKGTAREDSDIDLLVEIDSEISLLDFVGLKLEIEDVLGINVDLVEYSSIKPRLKEKILNEQLVII